ncbi:MAG TPA: hypothetical protein VGJ03_04740 [Acidimicrobiales bacterium]
MTSVSFLVALFNTALGVVYCCYGLITILDMKRGWRTHGFSHFGAAWIAMAFTCGPHHLDHGLHGFVSGRDGGLLDLVTILIGFVPGVIWFLLRVEALWGGRGDRFISGTPAWLEALPTFFASYTAGLIAWSIWTVDPSDVFTPRIIPNLCLVGLYAAIGSVLLRTQVRNHPMIGGWSVSGISLAAVMYTCALMHGVFALYANSGRYYLDWHSAVIDVVAVPAACYFLWVTYSLYRGSIRDWNASPSSTVARTTSEARTDADLTRVT